MGEGIETINVKSTWYVKIDNQSDLNNLLIHQTTKCDQIKFIWIMTMCRVCMGWLKLIFNEVVIID